MAFIGNTNTTQAFTPAIDYFSGNASTTAFTLSKPVASVAQVQVVVNNVAQNPSSAYTVSGNTITFTSAPSAGTNNIYVYYTSPITQVIAPGQNTVYPSSLSTTNALYWDTSGNVGIGITVPRNFEVSRSDANTANGAAAAQYPINIRNTDTTANNWASIGFNQGASSLANPVSIGAQFASSTTGSFAVWTSGAEKMRVDSSGNVGIGTASPSYKLDITNGSAAANCVIRMTNSGTYGAYTQSVTSNRTFSYGGFDSTNGLASGAWGVRDETASTWRMIIDNSGNLMVNATSQIAQGKFGVAFVGSTNQAASFNETSGAASWTTVLFQRLGTTIGSISNATSSTAYNTSSDYRLKNTIAPMTGALAKVQALKPVTYRWNIDDEVGEGFIAHELAEVCPHAVTGAKDAVDADGNPIYQGIDTSFLVATLTAAIQEQQALITALTARIEALENK